MRFFFLNSLQLTERGTTALGPAACVALGIMEYAVPGSKVVLCTDGMANMGVGNIEDAQGLDGVWNFYRDLAGRAKNMGIPISIISIAGSQCKMEILGSISEISGGDVDIIKAEEVLSKKKKIFFFNRFLFFERFLSSLQTLLRKR